MNGAVWKPVKHAEVGTAGEENRKARPLNHFAAPEPECGKSGRSDPRQRTGQDKRPEQTGRGDPRQRTGQDNRPEQTGQEGSTGQKTQQSRHEVVEREDGGAGQMPGQEERNGEVEKPTQRRSLSLRTRKRKRVSVAAVHRPSSDGTPVIGWCISSSLTSQGFIWGAGAVAPFAHTKLIVYF